MKQKICIFWFRRDLRLNDNAGLYHALNSGLPVLPVFIFDQDILQDLPEDDARVSFIYQVLKGTRNNLKQQFNSSLGLFYGTPEAVISELLEAYDIEAVYTNRDYEPYAIKRDKAIAELLDSKNVRFHSFKDQVIFEKNDIVKDNGSPYVVYTPYKKSWKAGFDIDQHLKTFDSSRLGQYFVNDKELPWISLQDFGFKVSELKVPTYNLNPHLIEHYEGTRNFPALLAGTSRLGPHLRFGTVSIREVIAEAVKQQNETFWNELIWREFFMQILWHFPNTIHSAFKPQYDKIEWRNDPDDFDAWKKGNTGYAMVDAGMRELNTTGYMHNRVRMLVASFLCKHLLIDWRWGEAYFAEKLLDFELSSNVGNWQWAAGSGVDAAPYFRIFNPYTQAEKFDKNKEYINKWVPEHNDPSYGPPIVEHKYARERCLHAYKTALDSINQ